MIGSDYRVTYNATRNGSPLHLVRRGVREKALCGARLQPSGEFRVKDDLAYGESNAANCTACLARHATRLSMDAHVNQFDPDGSPHWVHVRTVASYLSDRNDETVIVALLHDTVQDTSISIERLRVEHFPPRIVAAVDLLTMPEGSNQVEQLARVIEAGGEEGKLARPVLLAELAYDWRHAIERKDGWLSSVLGLAFDDLADAMYGKNELGILFENLIGSARLG